MKRGLETTEYWLTVVSVILKLGLGLSVALQSGDWPGALAVVGSAISAGKDVEAYIRSRAEIKVAYGKGE